MTTTVQNVKYMQSIYRKYQIFAIACGLLTLICASLSALSGIQLNNLRIAEANKLQNATLTNSQVNADVQKELKEAKLFLKSSQQQLSEEKEKVERLQQMLNGLERQLSAAQAKNASKAEEAQTAPKTEKSPTSATPRARKLPPSTDSKPALTPNPDANEAQPSDSVKDDPDAQIPAPKAISPSMDPTPSADQENGDRPR
jgi:hypothetical protein